MKKNGRNAKKTVAELIEGLRPLVVEYGVSDAYINYDGMHDISTDRPDWVQLVYTMIPGKTMDDVRAFDAEVHRVFRDQVIPFPANIHHPNVQIARKYYVPVFA